MHMWPRLIRTGIRLLLLSQLLLSSTLLRSQGTFSLTPSSPTSTASTVVDLFSTSVQVHIDLPNGLSVPGLNTDTSQDRSFVISRTIKVLSQDPTGIHSLQVSYLSVADLKAGVLPALEQAPTDIGASFKGKTYDIDCRTAGVTIESATGGTPSAASDDEAKLVKRECDDLTRTGTLQSALTSISTGQIVPLNPPATTGLFSSEVNNFSISTWQFTLVSVTPGVGGEPSVASFSVTAKADPSSQISQSFPIYEGEMSIDSSGAAIDLSLRSAMSSSEPLPDGTSHITSHGTMNVQFKRRVQQ